ncbi:MAG: hypothetical protein KA746_15060 [Pyrinomonadaceae bacterium]|nr:hypothetical protein [Pyrinomonadaceae bacterium]
MSTSSGDSRQEGSAMVIALMVMLLLMSFVALAITRTNSETIAASNDEAETKTFEAANASLEILTRNFNKIFETKLTIAPFDITRIQGQYPPVFDTSYNFSQTVTQTQATRDVVMTGEFFQGLNARRDEWQLDSIATDRSNGVQVALRRKFLNNRIPVFQFGIFYDDDLEFHPGPRFDFGGRVHSNGSIFLQAGTGVYFSSKVSAANHVFTDIAKNGTSYTAWGDNVFIKNASGVFTQLRYNMGSVLANTVNGAPTTTNPLPTAYKSVNWKSNMNLFQGNLLSNTKPLQLPIKINSDISAQGLDLVEVVKRGKTPGDLYNDGTGTVSSPNIVPVTATTMDDKVTQAERYYNKTGLRVSLADSKAKLPACSNTMGTAVTTPCGVRLDGDSAGLTAGAITGVRGYVPRPMTGTPAYQATAVNGDRFNTGNKETWIKIETVVFNPATLNYDTADVTQDILALGVTDAAPNLASNFVIQDANYNANGYDSRSIIELQRFAIPGPTIPNTTGATSTTGYITASSFSGNNYNYVMPGTIPNSTSSNRCTTGTITLTAVDRGTISSGTNYFPGGFSGDNRAHMKTATISGLSGKYGCVVPFPINMFDTREGLYNDTSSVFNPTSTYGSNVPWAGVMSVVDIDVGNLRQFLNGTWDTRMPTGTPYYTATGHVLRSTDIPQNNGWVLYVSDRRGDFDFDGEYDMEDVFGNNDGNLQIGEDVNGTGNLQADYTNEAVRYTGTGSNISPDIAAVFDHKFYRRAVRLKNGSTVPGIYNASTPSNTRGFTAASENGVYVQGNYNSTGISSVGTPTASTLYLPQNTSLHIPASIAGDSITILSNNWSDSNSFVYPFSLGSRTSTETTQRFAMLGGDTITSLNSSPNQGGGDPKMNGGVHNFMRFLEQWGTRFNYAGSLINLYNSHNSNGTFKCCSKVYDPPERNWVFDASFLDVNRLPPGTPYFQNIQMTGFQRIN